MSSSTGLRAGELGGLCLRAARRLCVLGAVSQRGGQTTLMLMDRWSVSVARVSSVVGSTTVKVAGRPRALARHRRHCWDPSQRLLDTAFPAGIASPRCFGSRNSATPGTTMSLAVAITGQTHDLMGQLGEMPGERPDIFKKLGRTTQAWVISSDPLGRTSACCQDWAGTRPMSTTVCWPSTTSTTALSAVTPS